MKQKWMILAYSLITKFKRLHSFSVTRKKFPLMMQPTALSSLLLEQFRPLPVSHFLLLPAKTKNGQWKQ